MNFETFRQYLQKVKDVYAWQNQLFDLTARYNQAHRQEYPVEISTPDLLLETVQLLSMIVEDREDWIGYYVFDLECGEKYTEDMVFDENDKPIPLKTIEDLWNAIKNSK